MLRSASASLLALCALATSAAAAPPVLPPAGDEVVPPPLSMATAAYFAQNPDRYAAFLAALPRRNADAAPMRNNVSKVSAASGTWTAVTKGANGLCNPLLLLDGTVLVHVCDTPRWEKLTPDANGDYADGTWSAMASMPVIGGTQYAPQYNASAVLPDGRVLIMGGEYNGSGSGVWTNLGAIYDPAADAWTAVSPPAGTSWQNIGDAQATILDDGTFLLGSCCASPDADAMFQPSTLGWMATGAPLGGKYQDEQGYTKLPNGQVFTLDIWSNGYPAPDTHAELYNPATGLWTYTTNAPISLADPCGTAELGPAPLRPNGTVVAFGGYTGCKGAVEDPTAIYSAAAAKWTRGPIVPPVCGKKGVAACDLADAPAAVLSTGNVLFAASAGFGDSPTHFFEFGTNNKIVQVADPVYNNNVSGSYYYNFLCLPNGQILMTDFSRYAEVYTPVGAAETLAAPSITSVSPTLNVGKTYVFLGKQLHGLTDGAYYGDDVQDATNYPLVRITNTATGHTVYAPTSDFTTMSIQRNMASKAQFTVPAATEKGPSTLTVVANGVFSSPVSVTVQ